MEQSDVSLDRMRTFVRIAERGNLAAVARETGSGQSTITRHLRELEEALGVSLLTRTTRRTALTEEGTRYYAQCLNILCLVEQASQEMRQTRQAIAGTVRISCTAALGVLHVSRLIFAFQDRNPGIRVEFSLTDERVDLVREGVDIAIRLGPLTDSSMKLRALGESERVLVATPDWLHRNGPLKRPEDLRDREGVRLSRVHGSDRLVLQAPKGKHHVVPFHGRLNVDHGLAARGFPGGARLQAGASVAGGGLPSGRPAGPRAAELQASPAPLSMLIAPERASLTRVRLCADFLGREIAKIPGIGR